MIEFRIRRSTLRAAVAAVVVAVAAFGIGNAFADHDDDVIHACANKQTGSLRVVNAASDCRSNETALEWSEESSIPTPQACPAGEFVTGIDGAGHLVCAKPGTTGGGGGGGGGGGLKCTDAEGDGLFDTPPVLPNATGRCDLFTGAVSLASCATNFWDLNGIVADGCEYGPVPFTGPEVCDGLDNDADGQIDDGVIVGSFQNATAACADGVLVVMCDPGFSDANGIQSDGCEAADPTLSQRSASGARTAPGS